MRTSISQLEAAFDALWEWYGNGRAPKREHRFHPGRKWRFDFAWPDRKVAVEIEGGVWIRGRHQRAIGFQTDCEKYNAAALEGWKVLRYTRADLQSRPIQVIEEVKQAQESSESRVESA